MPSVCQSLMSRENDDAPARPVESKQEPRRGRKQQPAQAPRPASGSTHAITDDARNAVLGAGWPETVPGTTVDRQCGSSQQAAHFAAQGVIAGAYDIAVAAGVESMSRVPMGSARGDADPHGPRVTERYSPGLVPQGISAELVAQKWGLSRTRLDEFAAASHARAAAAASSGAFDREVVAVTTPDGVVSADETIRPGTTVEIFAAGDRVVARWRYDYGNGHVRGVDVFTVRDGLVAEKLSYVKG